MGGDRYQSLSYYRWSETQDKRLKCKVRLCHALLLFHLYFISLTQGEWQAQAAILGDWEGGSKATREGLEHFPGRQHPPSHPTMVASQAPVAPLHCDRGSLCACTCPLLLCFQGGGLGGFATTIDSKSRGSHLTPPTLPQ